VQSSQVRRYRLSNWPPLWSVVRIPVNNQSSCDLYLQSALILQMLFHSQNPYPLEADYVSSDKELPRKLGILNISEYSWG
jgi:hypothetical protein